MKVEIKVPLIGESISSATVSTILVSSGGYVSAGQEILELETDKVNQVLSAEAGGQVSLTVSIGDTVQVGQIIGSIDTEKKAVEVPKVKEETLSVQAPVKEKTLPKEELKEAPPLAIGKEGTRVKMSALRKTIAARLVDVKNKTAMLTTFNEVDMTAVMAIREKEKEAFLTKHGVKLGFMSFFVKAVVMALKEHPILNAFVEVDEIISPASYNIGVAVSTDKGLVVPVIQHAEIKSFGEIEKEIAAQAAKARAGSTSMDDLKGGTFTITNGGVFGSLLSTPILNPPQSAILGMHAITKRAVVVDDAIVIRPMMFLALSYDHRIIDGKDAVLFLIMIKQALEDPSKLLLDL